MQDTIFLLIKATIATKHKNVHEAIAELQGKAKLSISDTKNVKVISTQLMDYKLKS
ncbi:hypothetical protein [Mucilaginibacter sp. KACC 22063]|uniref:hypothetical protein n=1 Tax=Mucilaginibacter sp. KACC 22063 TaxID=3025666 RepID=UPI002366216C|nr:hypothetical protein [Mucilaginibacter sp. KACC 22063]WDF57204.1 hypothetical protein PQ461_09070 [Mucilaginibacter sp. KACC 22063]